jgi:DNA-binding NtrC family response regulator
MSDPIFAPFCALVVDDDPGVRAATSAMLELLDCTPLLAESGEEAIARLEETTVDVVILDVDLPGMDGIATYEQIAEREPALPVIFSSGQRNVRRLSALLDQLTVQFLEKPYSFDQLVTALRIAGIDIP